MKYSSTYEAIYLVEVNLKTYNHTISAEASLGRSSGVVQENCPANNVLCCFCLPSLCNPAPPATLQPRKSVQVIRIVSSERSRK